MLSQIKDKLEKRRLFGWQARWARKKSHQSFLAREKSECQRQVETESCVISVYIKKGPEQLGLSTFKVTPADLERFDEKLEEALFAAGLVTNQLFELPEQPQSLPTVAIKDNFLDDKTLIHLEDRVRAAVSGEKQIRLSAAEFFINQIDFQLINHRGLDVRQEESLIHTEFILLGRTGARENEYINRYTRRFLKDFDLEGEVSRSAQFARDATAAQLPQTGNFPVVLSDEPLDHLFNPLVARASARLKYNKMMQMEIGQSVVEEGVVIGDTITMWSNGLLEGAVGSSRFDSYGTPLGRICLIEQNKLKTYLADKRYADYLHVGLTGELGNIELAPGSVSYKNLLDPLRAPEKTIYHLQAFSAFEPNAITGAFSAEIRAGTEITANGTRPIKGGSVSGVLQHDLLDCRLSSEMVQRERILCPQGILFSNLTLAGA